MTRKEKAMLAALVEQLSLATSVAEEEYMEAARAEAPTAQAMGRVKSLVRRAQYLAHILHDAAHR